LNFLTRLARDLDATAKPAGGALVFIKRGIGKAADGSDLPVPVINVTQMSRGNWKASGRGKYSKVIAEWSELGAAKVRQVSAGNGEPLLKLRHRYWLPHVYCAIDPVKRKRGNTGRIFF